MTTGMSRVAAYLGQSGLLDGEAAERRQAEVQDDEIREGDCRDA